MKAFITLAALATLTFSANANAQNVKCQGAAEAAALKHISQSYSASPATPNVASSKLIAERDTARAFVIEVRLFLPGPYDGVAVQELQVTTLESKGFCKVTNVAVLSDEIND